MVESEREQPPPDPSIHPAKDTNSALVHVGTHLGDTAQQLSSPTVFWGGIKKFRSPSEIFSSFCVKFLVLAELASLLHFN